MIAESPAQVVKRGDGLPSCTLYVANASQLCFIDLVVIYETALNNSWIIDNYNYRSTFTSSEVPFTFCS